MSQTNPDLQTIPGAKVKREFADKFLQYDFDWQRVPQEREKKMSRGTKIFTWSVGILTLIMASAIVAWVFFAMAVGIPGVVVAAVNVVAVLWIPRSSFGRAGLDWIMDRVSERIK